MGEETAEPGRMILPTLVFSRFATMPPGILTGLLLLDIGETFSLTVGIAGQVRSAASVVGVVFALLIGGLSLRFKPKPLLLAGLSILVVSAVGCALAPSFPVLLSAYALTGVVVALVGPMTFTLVADHFPRDQRANAISWIIAGMSGSYLVGAPIIGYISGFVGWRGAFLWFVLPVSLLGLLMAQTFIPSKGRPDLEGQRVEAGLLKGFTKVLTDISSLSCLSGTALVAAAYMAMVSYAPSFYRERFGLSTAQASLLIIVSSVFFIAGTRLSAGLVRTYGRKPITLWLSALAAVSIVAYLNLPDLWLSLAARFLGSTISAIVFTATNALTLEQLPGFRSTVMSLNQSAFSLGGFLGTALGGLVIMISGYKTMGVTHGAMMFIAMIVLHLYAADPTD
ncbi:MAG: MFS transporter [Candidatus Bathyarchaeota archaeon]|jgi:predicted MFS family arabinose efflux permease